MEEQQNRDILEQERPRVVTYAVYLIYISAGYAILLQLFVALRPSPSGEAILTSLFCASANAIWIALVSAAFGRAIGHGSQRGRIIYLVLTFIGLLYSLWIFGTGLGFYAEQPFLAVVDNAAFAMRLVAAVLIVLPSANEWFRQVEVAKKALKGQKAVEPTEEPSSKLEEV